MKTSLLSSKKCSTADIAQGGLSLFAILLSLSPSASASTPPGQSSLVLDINANTAPNFAPLLGDWEKKYGTTAITPLLAIARDHRNSDRQRYVALMATAKLGGPAIAEKITPLLKDKSWMIRSAALKALAALKDPRTSKAVLPLIQDSALVVRVEAIEAVKALRPEGSSRALVSALQSQDNYRFGKAQWVPQRALAALVVLQDRSIVQELRPLLDHQKDPALQQELVFALSALTGLPNDEQKPLTAQVENWKKNLTQLATAGSQPVEIKSAAATSVLNSNDASRAPAATSSH